MEYKFKTGVIAGIPTDETITVGFEDGTALTFGKSYWLGSSDPAAGMTVSVMFNRDMGIMGCNETVAVPRRETATDGACAAENAGNVKNKAAPRSEKNTYKDSSTVMEHSVWRLSVQDRDDIQEMLRGDSFIRIATRPLLKKYATFKGRAPRIEFWSYWIFYWTVSSLLILASYASSPPLSGPVTFLIPVFILFCILPSISLYVRRLHDIGKHGGWCALCLIPYIGLIILLWLVSRPSQPEDNKYGVCPLPLEK